MENFGCQWKLFCTLNIIWCRFLVLALCLNLYYQGKRLISSTQFCLQIVLSQLQLDLLFIVTKKLVAFVGCFLFLLYCVHVLIEIMLVVLFLVVLYFSIEVSIVVLSYSLGNHSTYAKTCIHLSLLYFWKLEVCVQLGLPSLTRQDRD